MTSTASAGFERNGVEEPRGGLAALKRWSAWEIGATVAGFVVFWPLGLIALFLKWKNGELWKGSSTGGMPWSGFKAPDLSSWKPQTSGHYGFSSSGNEAFDAYKREQLKRLDEERRRLEDEQRAFREFVEKVRKAKDQEEFDRFMSERNLPRQ